MKKPMNSRRAMRGAAAVLCVPGRPLYLSAWQWRWCLSVGLREVQGHALLNSTDQLARTLPAMRPPGMGFAQVGGLWPTIGSSVVQSLIGSGHLRIQGGVLDVGRRKIAKPSKPTRPVAPSRTIRPTSDRLVACAP